MRSKRLSKTAESARMRIGYRRRFSGRHLFDDRSTGASGVLIVLGGHKDFLSGFTLPRIARAVHGSLDVCLTTPGVMREDLRGFAAQHGWSYLSSTDGHVSVAQNLAIRAHPRARVIHKIDEDVFVSDGFFARMEEGWRRVGEEAEFDVGFCAPVINVNGFSFADYVREIGREAEWIERFGPIRRAHDGVPAQRDGEAAVWLWRDGIPVDDVAARFSSRPFGYSIVPHRFSIGAVVYGRDLWNEMHAFPRALPPPGLGEDEQHIAFTCANESRIIAVLHNVYAGHFSFGSQNDAMRSAYGQRLSEF